MRLAIVASHPIQYQAPLFRALSAQIELDVFFAIDPTPQDQGDAGFDVAFTWDVDLLSGYRHRFLHNVAAQPAISFSGCDTPEIAALLRDGRYDAVLVLGWYLKTFVQAIWACRRASIPVLVRGDNHLLEPRSRAREAAKRLIYPIGLRAFDAALHVGQRSRAYFRHYHVPEQHLFFAPHGIDEAAFAKGADAQARADTRYDFGIPEQADVALFVGKLIARKRVEDLIQAAALMTGRKKPLHVLIAGSGPLESDLQALAGMLDVPVHFAGFQNQSRMPAFYAASDMMVLPSDNESWGLVANEALACGKPVILSSAVGCAPDLAGDGRAGRMFRTGDPANLASMMEDLLDHPPEPAVLAARSAAYGTQACVRGILAACAFVTRRSRS